MAKEESLARPIMVIDDEESSANIIVHMLKAANIRNTVIVTDSSKTFDKINNHNPLIIITDLRMPEISGEDILDYTKKNCPEVPVVVVTAVNNLDKADECMENGAKIYFQKPLDRIPFIPFIKNLIREVKLDQTIREITKGMKSDSLKNPEPFKKIHTQSRKMLQNFKYAEAIKHSSEPVLITGETGVGKEVFARAVYETSEVSGEFVPVNLAGLDDNLFSDTLFGHYEGSFTDAKTRREGLIRKAENGMLFLDEIGELHPASQVKLLRLLQEREYYPIGSDKPKYSNAKIIAATNRETKELIKSSSFRLDLYYRLTTHHIHIPALKKRTEDIPLLAEFFIKEAQKIFRKKINKIPPEFYRYLANYSFPGNIRELRAIIFDAVGKAEDDKLDVKLIRDKLSETASTLPEDSISDNNFFRQFPHLPTLKQAENMLIMEAMQRTGNNQTAASALLGISQQAVSKRLKKIN